MLLDYEVGVQVHARVTADAFRGVDLRGDLCGDGYAVTGAVTGANGNSTLNVAPPPGPLSAWSLAPWACATPAEIASPRPDPRCFVVKNGSKMRSRSSGAMPGPVSATVTVISSVPRVTATRTSPPGGV